MSHFSVLVCVPADVNLEDYLNEVLERWNEGRDVEPYRHYEEGAPEDYWWVESVRSAAEHLRNGTGIKPYEPDALVWSSARSKYTPEEQRAQLAANAAWSERLGELPSWRTVAELYNERYHPGNEPADEDSDSERLHYDPDEGRAYTIRTYNPESMWDYWRIGGRWHNYFLATGDSPELIRTSPDWDSPKQERADGVRCDGGPVRLLDFAGMRTLAEVEAHKRYDQWDEICADTPPARSWATFSGLVDVRELSIEQAREQYHSQPRVVAAKKAELTGWSECPVDTFLSDREEYAINARRSAVPGYALITLDRSWVAPGRMGWFGMSSESSGERIPYYVAVNTYLDQLDPAVRLVVLDCHI